MTSLTVWYGKTVIHSKYKLFYEAAQNIIDETNLTDLEKDIPEFENLSMNDKKSEFKQLKSSLKLLLDISRHFRYQRLMKGGLELDSVEVQFELTSEKQVENLMLKESLEIHETVAEFMIMANHWVAKKIYEHFPHNALLRCHPKPNDEKLKLLVECAKIKDFVINTESNETLAKSLNNCVDLNDSYVNIFLRKLTTLSMHKALYFSTGSLSAENFIHFGLALDKYTHFTSPIRLYSNSNLQELSIHINEKTISAQYAQRASQQLYQCQYFKDKENSSVDAVITSIRSNGLVIDIPIYGLNGAVYLLDRDKKVLYFCNDLENCKSEWTDGSIEQLQHSLIVHTTMGSQTYTIFDHVTVLISPHVSSSGHVNKLKFELLDRRPHHVNESTKAGSQKHNINIVKSSVDIRKDKLKSLDLSFCEPKSDETLYDILCSMKNMALGASN
ncbi:DIS3-like exonuclease 1 [Nymphon striatum]|nr:DIS3-like exonuclease 1 [Nymphon striatum]